VGIGHTSGGATGDLSQHTARLVGYGLIAIFLMALDHQGRYLDRFHQVVREFSEPVLLALDAPSHWAEQMAKRWRSTEQLIDERNRLAEALRQQQANALTMAQLRRENEELRGLLALGQSIEDEFVSARVLSVDLNPFSHRLVINQGRRHGLTPAMAVVDQSGLIGQIDTVSQTTASVILITDPDHALPVRIARTGAITLAYGGGLDGDLSLPELPKNVDLVPNDVLESSGLGGVFPAGLPVGVITELIRPADQTFAKATAKPIGQHDRSRFVMVLQRSPIASIPEPTSNGPAEQPQDGDKQIEPSGMEDAEVPNG